MTNCTITREGNQAVIRLPLEDAHSLKVALAPCPCKAPKSNATAGLRERLRKALGRVLGGKR